MSPRFTLNTEALLSNTAITVTFISFIAFLVEGGAGLAKLCSAADWRGMIELAVGRSLVGFLLFSGLVYQFTRRGYLKRFSRHRVAGRSEVERVYLADAPHVAILVPSYKEEPSVVRRTLLAAALQQSPNRRVILLIDDPPRPRDAEDAANLARTRRLPGEIGALLAAPSRRFEQALVDFEQRRTTGPVEPAQEAERLAALMREAADWLDALADDTQANDHTDVLFIERILRGPARSHRQRAQALTAAPPRASIDLRREYRRLATLFKADLTTFERKRYANLSHEPNKAMNLNSYLGLMGRQFREVASPAGLVLEEANGRPATRSVPNADFILVLDADSLIVPEYSLRLVHFMTRPGHERVAVVQTPYASIPGAASMTERIAGATTDVQLIAHQGSTLFGAGSWVGASALVRRTALDDIAFASEERGYQVCSYVRDRTLNEDTDTTVDLIRKHWTVHNYPDRLAYSATPADFGSLLIQRRRWATGGLIILPNVVRYVLHRPSLARLWEGAIRAIYILSAPLGSLGIVILLFYPFAPGTVSSLWTIPAFLAYLVAFARDLAHSGSRARDLFRALALNAMLLPINLAGAINSIGQLWNGRKIPFQRTPKVQGRTAAPAMHVAAQLALLLLLVVEVPVQLIRGERLAGLVFIGYVAGLGYALYAFIGWRAALEDLRAGLGPRCGLLGRGLLGRPRTEARRLGRARSSPPSVRTPTWRDESMRNIGRGTNGSNPYSRKPEPGRPGAGPAPIEETESHR